MTYKQLVEAYYSAVEGPRAPILIAVNSTFCEWWAQVIKHQYMQRPGYETNAEMTKWIHTEVERIRRLRSALFHGAIMVFRPGVPENEIWLWFADAKLKEAKLERQGTKSDNTSTSPNQP